MSRRVALLAYAAPAVPLAFLGLPLYVYLPAHYAALPGIGLAAVGGVLLLARLIDLVTDPLVGLLSDRLRPHLRPQWLMLPGGALMVGGAWWLFQPPPGAGSLYLFAWLGATYLGWTLLAIPYYALGAELGARDGTPNGQTGVAVWREAGMIAGTLAALLAPLAVVSGDTLSASALTLLWLAPAALVLVLLVPVGRAYGVSSAPTGGLRTMWRNTGQAARALLGIHLLNALAGGTAATLFALYTGEVIGLDQRAGGLLLLLYFVCGLLVLPLWTALVRRIGLVRTWRAAMLLAATGFLPAALLGSGDWLGFAIVCIVTGATLGADIALPAAIQARIVTAESRRLVRPRGGALFGLWGMAGKLSLALAAGIALPLLAVLSMPATGLAERDVIPWLYAALPALIKLCAVLLLQRSLLWHSPLANLDRPVLEITDEPQDLVPEGAAVGVPAGTRRL